MITGGGGPPLNGPGEERPAPTWDGGGSEIFRSVAGPLDSVRVDCNKSGGPVRPGGGTTALAYAVGCTS